MTIVICDENVMAVNSAENEVLWSKLVDI
uniref:Uncharacterized protein n=1 Tax=Rhizophora mucronata TaxID=61149 RepID=A0A2P2PQG2_RHIMU